MNILIFNWRDIKNSWAGGSEIYIHEIAKRLVKKGHSVTLFCGQDPEIKLPEEEIIDEINVIRKGSRFSLYLWAPIYYFKKLRKGTDIIIDCENGLPFFTPLFSSKKKICVVHHVHGKQFFYELPKPLAIFGYILERYLFPMAYKFTKIIAVSNTTKKELIKIGFNKDRIKIVYNGLNQNKNSHGMRKFSRPTIIYLGRIKKYKRVGLLVNLMSEILSKVPNARLLIAGWGTEGGVIADSVMSGKNKNNVSIMGSVSEREKENLLERSWVFVNPSIHEGWGISVMEASFHGLPSVAFNVPGLSESIVNKKTGFLVKSNQEMIEKLVFLLKNKKVRDELGESAKLWAGKFNWNKSSSEFMKNLS